MPFIKGKTSWNKGLKMPFKHRKMAKGFMPVKAFKKGNSPWNKGKKLNYPVWNKGGKGRQKNHNIDGLKIGQHFNFKEVGYTYAALHQWVKRRLVRPNKCCKCGGTGKIQLANKSGKYLRNLNDWIWLCVFCHRQYDGLVGDWKTRPSKIKKRFNV